MSNNLSLVDNYLKQNDWKVKENSNMGYSLQGLNNHLVSALSKEYWLNEIYTDEIRDAHEFGEIHIHDLSALSVYCVGWDLRDLLISGFTGVANKSASKPAKHLRSALGQLVNFLYTLQGEASGAQAISNFDTLLAPFIRYDRLSYSQVKQALQEFLFNMNVPTRVGFQSVFSNVTLDLKVPKHLIDEPIIFGGEYQSVTYGDFQRELDIFNKAFLEVLLEGDADGRIFSFPIPTYNITKDFNWDNPILDDLWLLTAKYGVPTFSNFINSDMKPEDTRSMCCRLRLDNKDLKARGGLFGSIPLTGSIGVVTINLPQIGYIVNSIEEFLELLRQRMELAKESLEVKRRIIESYTDQDLYPYSKFYLRNIKKRFDKYWVNHFSTIGLIGLNEASLNLLGVDIASSEGREFAKKVLLYMRDVTKEFTKETGNNYNLEATPAEGVTYRLAKIDKSHFPYIKTGNIEGEYFYTNSSNLPVQYSDDIFEVLDHQDELLSIYTGGSILHGFIGERMIDTNALKSLIKTICEKYKLPFFDITPTFSICKEHKYIAGEHFTCPICGVDCEVYSRIVGYLRPVQSWNKGKQQEFKERKTYKIKSPSN